MVEQVYECFVDGRGGNDVVVIEHEDDLPACSCHVVDQDGQDRFDRQHRGTLQEPHRLCPDAFFRILQRRQNVAKEAGGLVVAFIK